MRRNVPPPPPRPLSKRLYDLDARNNDHPPPQRDNADDESEISDNDSILAMAKRLDASSVISDPSFIEGTQPHRFGLDPSGFGESGSTLGQGHPADMYNECSQRNQYYAHQRDLDSIASNDQIDEHSIYTDDDGSRSEYTEESMERNPYRNMPPPPGVPRVGHHDDMYGEDNYDSRMSYDEFYDRRGPQNGNEYRYQGGRKSRQNERHAVRGRDQSPNNMNRRNSRSPSPSMRVATRGRGGAQNADVRRCSSESSEPSRSRDTKQKLKLAAIPIIVLIVIFVAIAIVFANRGGGDEKNTSDNQELIQIAMPTSSPTYQGEYNCPAGYVGPVPTKGCLGYVQCNGLGGIEGEVLACPAKTLYDVNLNTCSWEESVTCSTISAADANDNAGMATDSSTASPTMKPVATVSTVPINGGTKVGPAVTWNHKLSFQGVLTLGDVSTFEKNMENYINIFFSPSRGDLLGDDIATLAANDPILNNLTEVKVDLTIKKFEWSGINRLRHLQENVELIMIYDQKTEYVTDDSSIKVGTVVKHPYEEQYEQFLIDYLKSTDDVFGSLTSVDFLESEQSSSTSDETSSPLTTPSMSPSETSESAIAAPSVLIETASPSESITAAAPVPITASPTAPTQLFVAFPEYATVQGVMWIDTNKNGLYETNEPPAVGTFANLLQCDDKWVQTTSSNVNGQYQFLGVQEGEYYVQFFKPTDNYEFTIPMMGSDDKALDSDVALLSGKSPCILVDSSFSQLINAGYVEVDVVSEETSTTTTALPESQTFKYCAQVTTSSGNQSFDFFGCSTRCSENADCDDGFRCLLSKTCSKQNG